MKHAALQAELFRELAEPLTGEALFDCFPDVVFFVKNRRAQYVVVNQTLVERLGLAGKDALIGRTADQLFPSRLGRTYRAQDEEVLQRGLAIRNQLELHFYPTGRRGWCITNKLPLRGRDGGVAGLYGMSKDLQPATERSEDFSHIAEAVTRIRTQYDQPLQVSDLARAAGLSTYQLDQRIRRIFQVTTGQLIQRVRMEAAVERLLKTRESIATIAMTCGYSDQSAFTRTFHRTVGMSPSEYRASFASLLGEQPEGARVR